MGFQGLRLEAQLTDADLLKELPRGAAADLRALVAATLLWVDRFADWQDYKADAPDDRADAESVPESRVAYIALDEIVSASHGSSAEYKAAYHEIVAVGVTPNASEVEARGMMTSALELARGLSEKVLADAKTGKTARQQAEQMTKVGQTEWPKLKYYTGGIALDMLGRSAPTLRKLAEKQPRTFGWVVRVLDYFGFGEDTKS